MAELLCSYGRALTGLARLHWVLAVSEISKGVLIVFVGDLVIADELGALLESRLSELGRLTGVLGAAAAWRRS